MIEPPTLTIRKGGAGMSGKRVLAVYAALLLGFMVVLCRLYLLAQHPAYAARAAAQSTVTLQLPARRGGFYDAQGQLVTGLEERWQVVCFPGQSNYDRLYACTDAAGQALLYRSRSRAAPFLLEVNCDPTRLGLTGYPTARRYAAVPLCQHLDAVLSGTGEHSSLVCAVTAQGTLRTGETSKLLQADSGALGVQLTISRPVQRAVEAVASTTMQSGCILVLDTATAAVRASVSVPGYDPEHLADSGWADLPLRGRGAAWAGRPCHCAGKKLQRLFYLPGAAAGRGKTVGCRPGVRLWAEPAAGRGACRRGRAAAHPAGTGAKRTAGQFQLWAGQPAGDTHAGGGTVQHDCSGWNIPRPFCAASYTGRDCRAAGGAP